MKIPIFGQTYVAQSSIAECEKTVNMYPELIESGEGRERFSFYPLPGLVLDQTFATSLVFSVYTEPFTLTSFAVVGNTGTGDISLYGISAGSATLRGLIYNGAVGFPPPAVSWASNGTKVLVTVGNRAATYNMTTTAFALVTAAITASIGGVSGCEFMDGYYIAFYTVGNTVGVSALNDPATWNALNVTVPSTGQGSVRQILVSNRLLWMFCSDRIEVWFDTANPTGFPFSLAQVIQQGTVYPRSVLRINNAVIWVGSSTQDSASPRATVFMATGYQPERISTHAIENDISGQIATLSAWEFQYKGHVFYVLSDLDIGNLTRVYDLTSKQWFSWESNAHTPSTLYPGMCHGAYGGYQDIVGDMSSGKIYQLTWGTYTDNSLPIKRVRRFPHFTDEGLRMFYAQLTVELEVGIATHQRIELDWSNNGGKTFVAPTGTINTNGTAVTWVSGTQFTAAMAGSTIRISDLYYTIASVTTATALVLSATAGVQTAVSFTVPIMIIDVGTASGLGYLARCLFQRMGSARDRVFDLTMVDPAAYNLVGGYLNVEPGNS